MCLSLVIVKCLLKHDFNFFYAYLFVCKGCFGHSAHMEVRGEPGGTGATGINHRFSDLAANALTTELLTDSLYGSGTLKFKTNKGWIFFPFVCVCAHAHACVKIRGQPCVIPRVPPTVFVLFF